MITLKNISKVYGTKDTKTVGLDNINISIEKGEFVSVMGTSGSGKTTLLNVIGAMDSITSGEYIFEDIHVENLSKSQLTAFRKENIGFVFQHFALMNHYTVFENIEMPLLMKRMPRKERKKQVKEALKKVGIEKLAKKLPNQLSGGQQQRCAIARAIVAGNFLILADEPTGALDSNTTKHIMELLKKLNEEGKTILIVTHDEKVAEYTNRVIHIMDGKVVEKIEK